jgi:hypothetical protein
MLTVCLIVCVAGRQLNRLILPENMTAKGPFDANRMIAFEHITGNQLHKCAAHSGDLERSIRSIMNTDSGDHEHPLALA